MKPKRKRLEGQPITQSKQLCGYLNATYTLANAVAINEFVIMGLDLVDALAESLGAARTLAKLSQLLGELLLRFELFVLCSLLILAIHLLERVPFLDGVLLDLEPQEQHHITISRFVRIALEDAWELILVAQLTYSKLQWDYCR